MAQKKRQTSNFGMFAEKTMPDILLVTETHGRAVSTQVIGDRLDDYIAYVIS